MKVYQCDACGTVIDDPYEIKMKEFYVGFEFHFGELFPVESKRKVKIHLCDSCYHGLYFLSERSLREREE